MFASVLKLLGGSLLVFALVWALVLGWWQSSDHEPDRLDILLYLGVLPLSLVGGFLLLNGFIRHIKAPPPATPRPADNFIDADPLAQLAASKSAEERRYTIQLVDAFVRVAPGSDVDTLLAAIGEAKRPEPSARLSSPEGYPLFLAEVPDLDTDALAAELREAPGQSGFAEDEAVLRGLTLLQGVLEQAGVAVTEMLADTGRQLQVVWLIPGQWQKLDQTQLLNWLRGHLCPDAQPFACEIAVATSEAAALRQLDQLIVRANRDPAANSLYLLISAVSQVDEESVMGRANAGKLFSAEQPQQMLPGEAALALLLALPGSLPEEYSEKAVQLSRLAHGQRDKPISSSGRIRGKLIEQLTTGLIDISGVEPAAIKALVRDGDQRSGPLVEALEGIAPMLEHLDPEADCLTVGVPCGDTAPLSALLALACTRNRVLADDAPALCLSNTHEVERALLLVSPVPPAPEPEPART